MKRIFSSVSALASILLMGAMFPMMALAQATDPAQPGPPGPPGPAGPAGDTTFMGMDPNVAIILGIALGAVVFLVVIVAIVAMVKGGGHTDVLHTP